MNDKLIYGCMRLASLSYEEAEKVILYNLEKGINFFDHSNIYGSGLSESLFGDVIKNNNLRDKVIIQTKCGIKEGMYDSSKESIIEEVEKSLKRLKTDYIDILLIHRPDALADYKEINEAFNYLYEKGMVKEFGVSNMNRYQLELFNRFVDQPIKYNQLQLSIVHAPLIEQGLFVNMKETEAFDRSSGTLEYMLLNDIKVEAWSPLMASWTEGVFIDNPLYKELNERLEELSNKYNVSKGAISLAWINKLPYNVTPVIGSTKINRIDEALDSLKVNLTRKEWYELYLSSGHKLP